MGTITISVTTPTDPGTEPLVYIDFDGTAFSFPLSGAKTLRDYLSDKIDEAQGAHEHQRSEQTGSTSVVS